MVYPSEEIKFKTAILDALRGHTTPETGLGYNVLFETVRKKVGGSTRTFNKYLNQFISTDAVRKEPDRRHKRGVIIYRTDSATEEKTLMELIGRIAKIMELPPIAKALLVDEHEQVSRDAKHLEKAFTWLKLAAVSDIVSRSFAKAMLQGGWWTDPELTNAYATIGKLSNNQPAIVFKAHTDKFDEKLEPMPPQTGACFRSFDSRTRQALEKQYASIIRSLGT